MIIYEKLMSGNYSDRFDSAGGSDFLRLFFISDFQSKITLSLGIGLFIKQLPVAALVTSVSMDDIGITQQGNVLSDHSV